MHTESVTAPEAVADARASAIRPPAHDTAERPAGSTGQRIASIDNARAIGIVLVVAGHAPALPAILSDMIFAFHMPLFFLLSGLVVGSDRLQMPTGRRARLLARSLLVPYVFYFIVSFVYWLVAKRHGLRAGEYEALPWWDPIRGFFSGSGDDLYINVVLWFLPCLYVVSIVHHLLCKVWSRGRVAIVAACAAAALVLAASSGALVSRWPWSTDCAVIGLFFFAIGALGNASLRAWPPPRQARALALASVVGFVCCYGFALASGHVDLNHLQFGREPVLYLPMGLVGTAAVLALAALLPATRIARWLSMNTLVIFPLHFLIFSVVTGVAIVLLGFPPDFKQTVPSLTLVYTAIALGACWPLSIVLRRLFPWLHAGRPSREPTAS